MRLETPRCRSHGVRVGDEKRVPDGRNRQGALKGFGERGLVALSEVVRGKVQVARGSWGIGRGRRPGRGEDGLGWALRYACQASTDIGFS